MLFKKDELKILWPFYLNDFLIGLSFMIFPFMVIYLRGLGFSFLQIGILAAAFDLGMVLFEIPTGAFADSFSRKYSVILGYVLSAIPFALIFFFTNFYVIMLLWVLGGIGMTFSSGADESWVIDNLNYHKRKDLHHEYFVKRSSISSISMIFTPFIGAILVQSGSIRILWLVMGGGFLLIAFLLAIFAKEMYKPKKLAWKQALKQTFHNSGKGIKFVKGNRNVLLLIIGTIFLSLMMIGEWGWQPFMVSLGLPTYALGYVYSIVAIGWVIAPFISKFFLKMKLRKSVGILTSMRILLLISVLFIYPPLFLLGTAVYIADQACKVTGQPLLRTFLHKCIPTKIRATVSSLDNMAYRLIFAIGEIAGGALMDAFGVKNIIALGAVFGFFAIATFLKMKDRNFPAKT